MAKESLKLKKHRVARTIMVYGDYRLQSLMQKVCQCQFIALNPAKSRLFLRIMAKTSV